MLFHYLDILLAIYLDILKWSYIVTLGPGDIRSKGFLTVLDNDIYIDLRSYLLMACRLFSACLISLTKYEYESSTWVSDFNISMVLPL